MADIVAVNPDDPASDAEPSIGLTDVMLAMDVVDTLRHQETLVARALNAEQRERALADRVRNAYASQGIEVSDDTIAAGVRALKDRQFAYTPPPPGLKTRFLTCWVHRRRLTHGISVVVALGLLIAVGWYGFVELPAKSERSAAVDALNAAAASAAIDIRALDERRRQLQGALDRALSEAVPADMQMTLQREADTASGQLGIAARRIERGSLLIQSPHFGLNNYQRVGAAAEQQLEEQKELLAEAESSLDSAAKTIGRLERLKGLDGELRLLRDQAKSLAVEAGLGERIDNGFRDGLAALRQGDVARAEAQANALKGLGAELAAQYTISVVSRPGELSGVIREPSDNPAASNYYLIVEALDASGELVEVTIRSEEDGRTHKVKRWGLRVDQTLFDRIRADKQDDGIIQNRIVGQKKRGRLTPDYLVATSGAAITDW